MAAKRETTKSDAVLRGSARPRALAGIAMFLCASMLAGCAAFVSHDEYGTYRRARLGTDERDRLLAMQEYVSNHPDGQWIAEVQSMRAEREDDLWVRSAATREGLEWYLQVYPDGRYVDQARPRLAALQHVANTAEDQAQAERELRERQAAEAAEARRTWVTRAVQYWTRTMVGLNGYGRPLGRIARANADFAQAFGREPAPVCVRNQYCIKHYGQLYHIPIPGATRVDRHIDVYLRLVMDAGRVERAEILMPDKGFSRWFEMENRELIMDEDPTQRFEAINWALERIQPIIEEVARGAQQVDLIPDPIPPLQVQGDDGDTEAAPIAPDEAPAEPTTPPPADPPPADAAGEDAAGEDAAGDEFNALLNQAAGGDETEPAPEPDEGQAALEVETETLVVPIGLIAYRYRNLRITVLAAGAEDYGEAYDGIIIERVRD